MAVRGGGGSADEKAGREASAWLARMRGPDADMSRLDFERWRARDPRHRAAYAEVERLWKLSAGLAGTATGRAYFARKQRVPFIALSRPRAAFAGIALLLAIGAGAILMLRGRSRQVEIVSAAAPLVTPIGEIHRLRLADGTIVTLDTDSAVIPAFTDAGRIVCLTRGRARFDVAHEPGRPFVVEAGGRAVIALGTMFDVVLGREGVRVTLLRGVVDIRDRTAPAAAAPVARLVPGQVFVDAPPVGTPQVTVAPAGRERWVQGMLSYDGTPLGDVLDETNRYAEHKIRLGDPALAQLRVTGSFRATPTAALADILAATFGLSVETGARGDFVLHARGPAPT